MELGYALSSEEHGPTALADLARKAEEHGFTFALISDHFHPWTSTQGNSPFVWAVLGAISQTTTTLRVGTGVTCPIIRMHPVIVAHAAATAATMMPGRFFLGLGTGENLNEHVTGARWPAADERIDMLDEAIRIIRELWRGEDTTFRGKYFRVEGARLYTLPDETPEIFVASSGERSAALAASAGDGLICSAPAKETVDAFVRGGGGGKPRVGQMSVCVAESEKEAVQTALRWWPTSALSGELNQELPLPRHFEQASKNVAPEDVAAGIVCSTDPERHLEEIQKFADAGFDHVYVHQVGPDQDSFFELYSHHILPRLEDLAVPA